MNLLKWLGFADRSEPAAPAERPRTDLEEYGATGTPIFGGFLRDLGEYNPDLEGLAAFSTYERMRRSDGQVAATLLGMKLPIRSAEWTVVEPDDPTPVEKEATVFLQECFEEWNLDRVIDNALLCLDFGAAAHEDVWYIDGNRVRLKKLAPRLPQTFHRWITNGEELAGLEQYAYTDAGYQTKPIPIDKMALFTFNQEGANYAGRSVMRPMYQHWYIKSNLYKVDAIACERNGMGVPWACMGEGAKKEDIATAIGWLEALSAHENAALLLPPGWTWGLKGVEGTIRDPKESIAHHNMAISMAGLAQFMMLGQSDSGNRALGQTMADFFYLSLQATANNIARVINRTTIQRLVDFNFGDIRSPRLVPQQILSLSFESIVTALKDLANANVNVIQPDDDFEGWVRSKMGAPGPGTPRPRPQPAVKEEQMQASEFSSPWGSRPGADSGNRHRASERRKHTPSRRAASCLEKEYCWCSEDGVEMKLQREPEGAERFLALADMSGALDKGRDDVAAILRQARSSVQKEVVNKVVNAPIGTMHRVSIAPDAKLVARIEERISELFDFGAAQVQQERGRQRDGRDTGDAATVREQFADRRMRSPLGVYADATVGDFINTLTQRAISVALDWLRRPGDLTKGEIIERVEEELGDQRDGWIDNVAAKAVNEAFADGRRAGYEEHQDEVTQVQYSALLDFNTCAACAEADGQTGATPDDITPVPNPDCEGGDKCRCVHVFVFGEGGQG